MIEDRVRAAVGLTIIKSTGYRGNRGEHHKQRSWARGMPCRIQIGWHDEWAAGIFLLDADGPRYFEYTLSDGTVHWIRTDLYARWDADNQCEWKIIDYIRTSKEFSKPNS